MRFFSNFVADEFRKCLSQKELQVLSATGEAYAVPHSEPMDLVQALQHAKKAQAEFEKWTSEKRAEALLSIAWGLEHRADEWAQLEAEITGLPLSFVKDHSILAASRFFHRQASLLALAKEDSKFVQFTPLGLHGILTSWACGTRLIAEVLAPALAAGNACVVKPSSLNPVSVEIFGQLLAESGLPSGLVTMLLGPGKELGQFIASHPSIRGISYCGSEKVGYEVLKTVTNGKKVFHIENYQKNSLILVDGWQALDFEEVMRSVSWGWGQTLWSPHKIFMAEAHLPEFKEKVSNWLSAQKNLASYGSLRGGSYSLEKIQKIQQQLKTEHAKFLTEERASWPLFALDLPNCSEFQQEREDLPIYIVNTVKYTHEIAKWVGNSETGFRAVIYGNLEKALKLAEKLPVGSVEINTWLHPSSDFHYGIKNAFWGSEGRDYNSPRFSYVKKVTVGI